MSKSELRARIESEMASVMTLSGGVQLVLNHRDEAAAEERARILKWLPTTLSPEIRGEIERGEHFGGGR